MRSECHLPQGNNVERAMDWIFSHIDELNTMVAWIMTLL